MGTNVFIESACDEILPLLVAARDCHKGHTFNEVTHMISDCKNSAGILLFVDVICREHGTILELSTYIYFKKF